MSVKNITYTYPIKGCKQGEYTSNNIIKDHLLMNHITTLDEIINKQWTDINLHKCTICNDKIYTPKGTLTRHMNSEHKKDKI